MDIRAIFHISKLDFMNYKTQQFNLYCQKYSYEYYVPQSVFQENKPLQNWYTAQWNAFAENWEKEYKVYIDEKVNAPFLMFQYYDEDVAKEILKFYPKVILKEIRNEHYNELKIKNITSAN